MTEEQPELTNLTITADYSDGTTRRIPIVGTVSARVNWPWAGFEDVPIQAVRGFGPFVQGDEPVEITLTVQARLRRAGRS